ncbi:MAG: septum formation protein Maf [Elusimicrobia bacterium]|nr:septum formation protein Maf [Elusimicrobiota bacterium]
MITSPSLILASASPQRKRLLRRLGVPFRVIPSGVVETNPGLSAKDLARRLAVRKVRAVAGRFPHRWVLGADTVVACRGKIFGKPRSISGAFRILKSLNGRRHRVYTGVALWSAEARRMLSAVEVSHVLARTLPAVELWKLAGKNLDKSGAYGIQSTRDRWIAKVVGPVDNVIGLPLKTVRTLLRKSGFPLRRFSGSAGR